MFPEALFLLGLDWNRHAGDLIEQCENEGSVGRERERADLGAIMWPKFESLVVADSGLLIFVLLNQDFE